MVEVAETTGRLEEALTSIARERQRTETLRKKFISSISYPLFLVFAASGVLVFVLAYIIPSSRRPSRASATSSTPRRCASSSSRGSSARTST